MKVLLINGSPNEKGCTNTALSAVSESLNKFGIKTETIYIAAAPMDNYISACCDFKKADEIISKAKDTDGFVFGSPVHYAAISSVLKTFMDYFFWMCGDAVRNKPVGTVVSARRNGTSATIDQMNKYFSNAGMHIVTCTGGVLHGNSAEEAAQDLEGLFTMDVLGQNMAWLLKCIESGKSAGIIPPKNEKKPRTSFIR